MPESIELPTLFPHITAKQQQVLRTVHSLVMENRYYPSHRELATRVGLSTQGVRVHVEALIKKGFLARDGGWRSMRFEDMGLKYLAVLREQEQNRLGSE